MFNSVVFYSWQAIEINKTGQKSETIRKAGEYHKVWRGAYLLMVTRTKIIKKAVAMLLEQPDKVMFPKFNAR